MICPVAAASTRPGEAAHSAYLRRRLGAGRRATEGFAERSPARVDVLDARGRDRLAAQQEFAQ
ncbi:hypothetical protein [Nocardia sp. MW-W600-9]